MTAPAVLVDEQPAPAALVIDRPGVYTIPAEAYHADPVPGGSLSSSGARRLLPPSCPALYRHEVDNGTGHRPTWDIGTAAHKLVLGIGPDLVLVDRDRWDTKEIKAKVAAIREAGRIPLKREPYEQVHAMATALEQHPVAAALFHADAEGNGQAEQSLFWADRETGIRCRARLDWLPAPRSGRMLVPDYKTCVSAAPDDLQKAIANHGYHQQAAWYLDGVRALGLAGDDAQFLFVCQMKTAPYLVTVVQPDRVSLQIGRFLNRQARELYARCQAEGRWPGFSDDVEIIPLPRWVETEFRDEEIW